MKVDIKELSRLIIQGYNQDELHDFLLKKYDILTNTSANNWIKKARDHISVNNRVETDYLRNQTNQQFDFLYRSLIEKKDYSGAAKVLVAKNKLNGLEIKVVRKENTPNFDEDEQIFKSLIGEQDDDQLPINNNEDDDDED